MSPISSRSRVRCTCESSDHFVLFILGFIFPLIWVIGAAWSRPEPSQHLNWQPGGRDDELTP